MRNFMLTLRYDGGRYNGWQKQGNTDNTIQEKLERICAEVTGEDVTAQGAGRTDRGVHAMGQCISFHLAHWSDSPEALQTAINEKLPEDIAVTDAQEKEPRFHSRLNAKGKWYTYTVWHSKMPPVFWRKYAFWCQDALRLKKMREAAKCLEGTHDFRSFCANRNMKKSTVRTIYAIHLEETEQQLRFHFFGDGFLYHMIRILVGTLIEVGEGKKEVADIPQILAAKNRQAAGFTAPAHGLCLREVFYHTELLQKKAKEASYDSRE